jgi:holo-[acyl-carrier protein] synthase
LRFEVVGELPSRGRTVIVGIGVDLFSVTRVEDDLDKGPQGLRDQIFTPEEIAYCESKRYPGQHFAARFAAKEAVFKALGASGLSGSHWRDVEVRVERTGRSYVILSGKVREAADALHVSNVFLSLSHTRDWAVASVVLEAADDRTGNRAR